MHMEFRPFRYHGLGSKRSLRLFMVDISHHMKRRPQMKPAATHGVDSKQPQMLHMSMELGRRQWKLGFSTGLGQKARRRTVDGDDAPAVLVEIAAAKRRFGLPDDCRVV